MYKRKSDVLRQKCNSKRESRVVVACTFNPNSSEAEISLGYGASFRTVRVIQKKPCLENQTEKQTKILEEEQRKTKSLTYRIKESQRNAKTGQVRQRDRILRKGQEYGGRETRRHLKERITAEISQVREARDTRYVRREIRVLWRGIWVERCL